MSWLKIFTRKALWIHLSIIISITAFLLFTVFVSLKIYTQHGKSKPLPDFFGLTEPQLQHLIASNDLRYIIIDSIHTNDVPRGVVIEQEPKAGEHVKRNRKIFFTINAWSEEQVSVPNLQDYSLRNAKVILESFGLKIGELIYVPSEYASLVLGQHYRGKPVEPGTLLPKSSAIDLLIGSGLSSESTNVPNLRGLDKKIAEQIIQSLLLNFGAVIYDQSIVSVEDSASAFIWQQRPEAGTALSLGASIDIWLTLDDALIIAPEEEEETLEIDTNYEDEFN